MRRSPGLRVPRHRATTANLAAVYPFQASEGLGARGVYLGTDLLTGGGAFCFDPFELYTQGLLTSPNVLVLGEVGSGKSAAVKLLLYRSLGVLGSPGGLSRWAAILDPKGEYGPLAAALGLTLLKLHPGGTTRLNPLDAGPGGEPEELAARRAGLVGALAAELLDRDLTGLEDAALGWAVTALSCAPGGPPPVLADVARLLSDPSQAMLDQARLTADELARAVSDVRHALGKLLDRDLRGMFDGPSTAAVDWSGRGVVLDLSAVHADPRALRLVMVAATGWLQAVLASPAEAAPRRYQVLEEVWALLGSQRTARYLQASFKLSRAYGVANIAVAHRASDLYAQSDDGTAAAKVAAGLLADTQTRVLFRQGPDQVDQARRLMGLTSGEAALLPELACARALWKVAGRTAVVQHRAADTEWPLIDTDAHLLV